MKYRDLRRRSKWIKLALIHSGTDSNAGAPTTMMRAGQRQTQTAVLSSALRAEDGNGNVGGNHFLKS